MKPSVSVIVTDLDNTLYDWFDIWYRSFKPMLDSLVRSSGVDEHTLVSEFKAVFERHGTSEYAFAIEELPSLQAMHPDAYLAKVYAPAIDAYRQGRRNAMRLYPNVLQSLLDLRARGCLIVGYTESMAFYSNYRVRNLGLDGLIDFLYSPSDHELPDAVEVQKIRRYAPEHYELKRTVHRHTPAGARKPSPRVLSMIVEDVGARPEDAIYVGDNLMKDVAMAKRAGITSVWAKYGQAHERPEYTLLRRVTHWPSEDVEREDRTTKEEQLPDYTLHSSFEELRQLFAFRCHRSLRFRGDDCIGTIVEVWKKTVDVQQHFNDLELRIRSYAVTLLVGVLTITAFALKEKLSVTIGWFTIPLGSVILLAGLIGWGAFYLMDRFWYHRLLYGAVKHGEEIESRLKAVCPEICLTQRISAESPVRLLRLDLHTHGKMNLFYLLIAVLLAVCACGIWLAGRSGDNTSEESLRATPTEFRTAVPDIGVHEMHEHPCCPAQVTEE